MAQTYFLTQQDFKTMTGEAGAVTMTVEEARNLFDDINDLDLAGALDEAQGAVHSGSLPAAYLVIKILP